MDLFRPSVADGVGVARFTIPPLVIGGKGCSRIAERGRNIFCLAVRGDVGERAVEGCGLDDVATARARVRSWYFSVSGDVSSELWGVLVGPRGMMEARSFSRRRCRR